MGASAVRMARKRRLAREAGLCTRCCKATPVSGRLICAPCKTFTVHRRREQRKITRAQRYQHGIVDAHERAGDVASEHNFHAAAAEHYRDALRVQTLYPFVHIRLTEKLAKVLWQGNDPAAATALYDRLLDVYRIHPELGAKAVEALFGLTRQRYLDSRTEAKLPLLSQAMRIAESSGDPELLMRTVTRMANSLSQLGRHPEALRYLERIDVTEIAHFGERAWYWVNLAQCQARLGKEDESFAALDRAVDATKDDLDPYRPAVILADYSLVGLLFGRTKVAKACLERALLQARRGNIAWLIPRCCLQYAELLGRMGQAASAYPYLLEALAADAKAPMLDAHIAYIGIPLALEMKDQATLARCTRPAVIEQAFLNGAPGRIGWVAAAFARSYVEHGQRRKAEMLLHRAVRAMPVVDNAWHLPLEVARSGALSDIPQARALLEARLALPRAQVAEAVLRLFDALAAQREEKIEDCHRAALDAAARFEQFHWGLYANLARSLLPVAQRQGTGTEAHHAEPLSELRAKLTAREWEVAILILKGLSNRAISQGLSITENTVEKHVASVMNKLGIRSRHQLAGALANVR